MNPEVPADGGLRTGHCIAEAHQTRSGEACDTRIDIYCRVIDHLGDIAASLRLAKDLARSGYFLRLYCDRLDLARALAGEPDEGADRAPALVESKGAPCSETPDGSSGRKAVELCAWPEDLALHEPSLPSVSMLISAFGCELPQGLRSALVRPGPKPCGTGSPFPPAPLWVHLDYLSAECWVKDFNGRVSIKPDGVQQVFAFPGFDAQSAGLPGRPPPRKAKARTLAVAAADLPSTGPQGLESGRTQRIAILAYAYAHAMLGPWAVSIAQALCTPAPRLESQVFTELSLTIPTVHASQWPTLEAELAASGVRLSLLQPCSQVDWDRTLAASDLLLVRGEDSWVGAMRSGIPWLWQPYPQEEPTVRKKLDALLDRMDACLADLPGWHHWRSALAAWGLSEGPPQAALEALMHRWPQSDWQVLAQRWADHCNAVRPLAETLSLWLDSWQVSFSQPSGPLRVRAL